MNRSGVPAHWFFYGTLVAGNPNPVAAAIHAALEPLGPARRRWRLRLEALAICR